MQRNDQTLYTTYARSMWNGTHRFQRMLARLMVVTLTEDVLRMIPRGAHDPAKFIRPDEMKTLLRHNEFAHVGEFSAMGIVSLDRHLDPAFGLTGSTKIMYRGCAQ